MRVVATQGASGKIYLNNLLVLDFGDVTKAGAVFTVDVMLPAGGNTIEVRLQGKPGSGIDIEFR